MNGNTERFTLRFCERYLASKLLENCYSWCRELHEYNLNEIIGRYEEKANKIMQALPEVKIDTRKHEGIWVEMTINGSIKNIAKALRDHVFVNSMPPPETKIVLPRKNPGPWGSSLAGYATGYGIVTGMYHEVKEKGQILRKGLDFKSKT